MHGVGIILIIMTVCYKGAEPGIFDSETIQHIPNNRSVVVRVRDIGPFITPFARMDLAVSQSIVSNT